MQGDVLNLILPTVGSHRPQDLPIWEGDRKMFLMDERESKGGNRSYKGVRVTDRFMTVEYVGNYHTITYINAIELYVYDGKELKLAGKKEFHKQFYDKQEIRGEHEKLLTEFLKTQARLLNRPLPSSEVEQKSRELIESSYLDLTDANAEHMLRLAGPMLPQDRYLEY